MYIQIQHYFPTICKMTNLTSFNDYWICKSICVCAYVCLLRVWYFFVCIPPPPGHSSKAPNIMRYNWLNIYSNVITVALGFYPMHSTIFVLLEEEQEASGVPLMKNQVQMSLLYAESNRYTTSQNLDHKSKEFYS